ncbi:UNKNOWN [Stylonychia lemnae]|uniref:Transmembrane protein n=1 Tax=Stylonychia lemnae TaxID=5949 RepID=A0A078ATB6_STYLE|nr:UNKNOWN [Stylonychia lemnae]|eukprot:CDW84417.1 UNKNOWN [Stylonychia lemnae]
MPRHSMLILVTMITISNQASYNQYQEIIDKDNIKFHLESQGIRGFDKEDQTQETYEYQMLQDNLIIARKAQEHVKNVINMRANQRMIQSLDMGNLGNMGDYDLSSFGDLTQYNISTSDLMNIKSPSDVEKIVKRIKDQIKKQEQNDFYSMYKSSFFTINKCIGYVGQQLSMLDTMQLSSGDVKMSAIPKSLIEQLKGFFKTFKIAYKTKYGEDILTQTNLDNDSQVVTLFLQGGMNSLSDLEEADSKNASKDDKMLIIIVAIVVAVFLISIIITLICVFTCCTKIKQVDGKNKRVCRKATKKCTCMKKCCKGQSHTKKTQKHSMDQNKTVGSEFTLNDDFKSINGPANNYNQVQNASQVFYGTHGRNQSYESSNPSMGIPVTETSFDNDYMANSQNSQPFQQRQHYGVKQLGSQNQDLQKTSIPLPKKHIDPNNSWQ